MEIYTRQVASEIAGGNLESIETFGQLIGGNLNAVSTKIVGKMLHTTPRLTLTYLLTNLRETYGLAKVATNMDRIENRSVTWDIKSPHGLHPKLVESATTTNAGKTTFDLNETFYIVTDVAAFRSRDFVRLENNQQLQILHDYIPDGDRRFKYAVRIANTVYAAPVSASMLGAGRNIIFNHNLQPEVSYEGGLDFSLSWEAHREYMAKFRLQRSASAELLSWKGYKDLYAKVDFSADELVDGMTGKSVLVNLSGQDMLMLERYAHIKENYLIFGESTVTANGKVLETDKDGSPLISGNGIIAQIAESMKFMVPRVTKRFLMDLLENLSQKTQEKRGNTFVAVCGTAFYRNVVEMLDTEIKSLNIIESDLFVKKGIKGSAKYDLMLAEGLCSVYSYMGNKIIFMENDAFSSPHLRGTKTSNGSQSTENCAIIMDFSMYNDRNNVFLFTQKGRELITSTVEGVGGADGRTSGKVASLVEATTTVALGYAGVAVQNPYACAMIQLETRAAQ